MPAASAARAAGARYRCHSPGTLRRARRDARHRLCLFLGLRRRLHYLPLCAQPRDRPRLRLQRRRLGAAPPRRCSACSPADRRGRRRTRALFAVDQYSGRSRDGAAGAAASVPRRPSGLRGLHRLFWGVSDAGARHRRRDGSRSSFSAVSALSRSIAGARCSGRCPWRRRLFPVPGSGAGRCRAVLRRVAARRAAGDRDGHGGFGGRRARPRHHATGLRSFPAAIGAGEERACRRAAARGDAAIARAGADLGGGRWSRPDRCRTRFVAWRHRAAAGSVAAALSRRLRAGRAENLVVVQFHAADGMRDPRRLQGRCRRVALGWRGAAARRQARGLCTWRVGDRLLGRAWRLALPRS